MKLRFEVLTAAAMKMSCGMCRRHIPEDSYLQNEILRTHFMCKPPYLISSILSGLFGIDETCRLSDRHYLHISLSVFCIREGICSMYVFSMDVHKR
jgi:hypothetical protein